MVRANLEAVQERIGRACRRSGREPKDITLVAVTKKVSQERIIEALSCGVRQFGESYVQEARLKIAGLVPKVEACWHMIGRLQSNKIGRAVEIFDVIQSVDSFKLFRAIDLRAFERGKVQKCFVEVKLSLEAAKTGLSETELQDFFKLAKDFKNVRIGGIMMMSPYFDSPESARPYFARGRKIFERLFLDKSGSPELSMGMSGDFEVAIEEGSTMVRIGRAIFGARA